METFSLGDIALIVVVVMTSVVVHEHWKKWLCQMVWRKRAEREHLSERQPAP